MAEKQNIRIGMTECGCDPGIDFQWKNTIKDGNGAILISKNINNRFISAVMEENKTTPITVHVTCTGWGGTVMEPNVPGYDIQLGQIQKLIDAGFPSSRIVLRIDPIIPVGDGIKRALQVIDKAISLGLLPGLRVRISVMDNYKHVIERFRNNGLEPLYGGSWSASTQMFEDLIAALKPYGDKGITFEACAEPKLAKADYIKKIGCLSNIDLANMGLPLWEEAFVPKQRHDCECLPIKFQLIKSFTPCQHGCLYCYWKDKT